MRVARFLVLLCIASASLYAQPPQIYYRGVVNAAHFLPQGLAQGAIARGSVFSIFGARLGPATSPGLSFPLQSTLGGTSVKVTLGTTSVDAIPVFVSPGQVNAIMPSNAPIGTATITVTFNGREGTVAPVRIVSSSFGVYTALGTGNGPGIIQNFVSQTSQPLNSPATPAKPGQLVTMWGTGLGAVAHADNVAPTATSLPTKTEVFVGGKLATLAYNGRSPCCAGSDQIVFTLPTDVPIGCWVPVEVRTEDVRISNVVTISVSADGSPCSDSGNPYSAAVRSGGKLGAIRLTRTLQPIYGLTTATSTDTTQDLATISLRQLASSQFAFDPGLSLPPLGTCTIFAGSGGLGSEAPALPSVKRLNGGTTYTVAGSAGSRTITLASTNSQTVAQLGKLLPDTPTRQTLFLTPGDFTVSNSGGADVTPFQARGAMPAALTWTNRGQTVTIDRRQPLPITWTGSTAGQIVEISGGVAREGANASVEFACYTSGSDSRFTVPVQILQAIPQTGGSAKGAIRVGNLIRSTYSATGLDSGVLLTGAYTRVGVNFR
jgi:uncharacterized protein (TIGR03437 family)